MMTLVKLAKNGFKKIIYDDKHLSPNLSSAIAGLRELLTLIGVVKEAGHLTPFSRRTSGTPGTPPSNQIVHL